MIITDDINKALEILLDKKILIIFQRESEWGPRALGNRSTLFDPRVKDAHLIVNEQKGREWWRPVAGTILKEHVHEWFDIGNLKESPYMSFAVDAKEKTKNIIPSIVHVDGTCRIQTLDKKFNSNYYDLINLFYKETGVPILLNTSFNLAGFPIPEKLEEAVRICKIKDWSLYLPVSS
jgi:carbamoyltransferase